ncbi:MAG TPA: hypothetical protein VMU07_02615 [Candidatus Paceibacterota bacterium]|nr:hypothetical protein [Candidatus Paceibacterota bacterium]
MKKKVVAKKSAQRKFPYQIEYYSNPEYITIHARSRFPELEGYVYGLRFAVTDAKEEGKKVHPFYLVLNRVRGITEVSPHDYELTITKAPMFSWDEMLPQILKALQDTIAGKRKLVEVGEPKQAAVDSFDEALGINQV